MTETIHLCPPDGSGIMPCCGRTPFEVPRTDRMTLNDDDVTCGEPECVVCGKPTFILCEDCLGTPRAKEILG